MPPIIHSFVFKFFIASIHSICLLSDLSLQGLTPHLVICLRHCLLYLWYATWYANCKWLWMCVFNSARSLYIFHRIYFLVCLRFWWYVWASRRSLWIEDLLSCLNMSENHLCARSCGATKILFMSSISNKTHFNMALKTSDDRGWNSLTAPLSQWPAPSGSLIQVGQV